MVSQDSSNKSARDVGSNSSRLSRSLRTGFVFLLCFLWPLAARGQQSPHRVNAKDLPVLLRSAQDALDHKDFVAAVKALKSVVEIDPRSTVAWFNLAFAYSGLHDNEQAILAYRKTLELSPDLFEARLNLGILLIEMEKPKEALDHLAKAVALKPEHTRAHLYYGRALAQAGQADGAEKQYEETLRLEPNLAIAHYDLGQLYLSQKRYSDALAAFQKATELDPKLVQAQLGSALALEGLKRPADAVPYFENYLAAQPGDLETRFHLARIFLEQGKNEKAFENLQAVYQAKPDLAGLAAALGDVCALLKKFPESERFYRQALAGSPGETDLHRALAQTLLDQEKFPEAEAEFRAALKIDPRNRDAAKGLATTLYLEERYQEAIPLLEALARAPDPPVFLYFVLASSYDHLRMRPNALEAYERFLELSHNQNPDQEWQARQRVKLLRRELGK